MLSLSQTQKQILTQRLELPFTSVGELELFSLHRIKNRIDSMNVHELTRKRLIGDLLRENHQYTIDTGNKWSCLTPTGLDNALGHTIDYLEEQMNLGLEAVDNDEQRAALKIVMEPHLDIQNTIMKRWFSDNYDALLYHIDSRIPYPIVMQMRRKLAIWAVEKTNQFDQPIEELIGEAARSVGLDPKNYGSNEDIWEDLKGYKGK